MTSLSAWGYAWPLATGLAAGIVYFALLARTTRLHLEGAPWLRLVPLFALRAALALALFWAVAHEGALALILALAGFLVGRLAVQYAMVARS
jgi:F1F0 ATPase subunit 2